MLLDVSQLDAQASYDLVTAFDAIAVKERTITVDALKASFEQQNPSSAPK